MVVAGAVEAVRTQDNNGQFTRHSLLIAGRQWQLKVSSQSVATVWGTESQCPAQLKPWDSPNSNSRAWRSQMLTESVRTWWTKKICRKTKDLNNLEGTISKSSTRWTVSLSRKESHQGQAWANMTKTLAQLCNLLVSARSFFRMIHLNIGADSEQRASQFSLQVRFVPKWGLLCAIKQHRK